MFFIQQKTAYEMRISDWSSDVCSSDLPLTSSAASDALSAMQKKQDAGNAAITLPQLPVADGAEFSGTGAGEEERDQGHYQPWEQDPDSLLPFQIGRASCRERVGQYC